MLGGNLMYDFRNKKVNWRLFPLFLLILFLIGLLLLLMLANYTDQYLDPVKRVPIIIEEEPEKVGNDPLVIIPPRIYERGFLSAT